MDQSFRFNPTMTHTFLKYAEKNSISNQRVRLLIDDLRNGLYQEAKLQDMDETMKLYFQRQKNVLTCQCILLHIQCLADVSDNKEQYDRFINDWNSIAAS